MKKTIKEIASLVSGEASGDSKIVIKGAANPEEAKQGDITFAMDERSAEKLAGSGASAAIVPQNLKKSPRMTHIKVANVRLAMVKVLSLFENKRSLPAGIHKYAVVSKSAKIGRDCCVSSGAYIGDNSSIGDGVKIYPGCNIGNNCTVGRGTTLYPNVVLYDRTVVGQNCILHAGAVIGVDGFGFAPFDGKYEKIPQIGNVVIEDDVEIFANVCISRATLGSTIIKKGTKIDNISHIAHNCKIGQNCAITALVAIAGSTELKDHVSIGGTSGINDHIVIGENTVIMGRSGVTKDIPPNSVISGFPAQDHKKELELQAAIRKLPKIIDRLTDTKKPQ